ncbi:sucrose nonfermenting 4-like protein isoform X2 [Morus notabilis]|uniref:sucrose nonfermenting 4-like protein isoform X2 n=1 Tax=Morus notabilis TaxID=981085 RepID=UPI000CECF62F|nr:sucrose nonfermenting 4-like protein isoform X2 [Morus notabilis]
MFGGSGAESGHESSGGHAGSILIPTRFVWPYGGRRVFLSGSFTRWSEHIPMSPVEGCPTVFQVVWNLSPGYHQYKFYVDGEWRHDEQQQFVSGNYGVVNTIFLSGEPDMVPNVFPPEAPDRANMDVDNDVYMPMEAIPQASESDIEISRHRISAFLSTHTAYELLPESGKVIAFDINMPVKQAFHILYEQGIPVAPLWNSYKSQCVGVLTALDFVLILRELGNHGSNLTEEELETHTIAAWKEVKLHLNGQMDDSGRPYPRHLIHSGPCDSLKDVALKIFQNKVSTIPIIHSSSRDGSYFQSQLLHLASLSGILKCICRHFRHSSSSLPILQQPICAIPLGTWVPKIGESSRRPLAMLRPNTSLSAALSLLVQVSSVPIVDDNDSLLDIYSRSDITDLAKDKAYARISLDEMSIHEALQLGQDANSPYGVFNGQRCQMCLPSDPLHKVMERLSNPRVRRLVIVEAGSKRVEGIVSLSDVFRFLLGLA